MVRSNESKLLTIQRLQIFEKYIIQELPNLNNEEVTISLKYFVECCKENGFKTSKKFNEGTNQPAVNIIEKHLKDTEIREHKQRRII